MWSKALLPVFYLFIWLGCVSVVSRGLSLVASHGLLTVVAYPGAEQGLWACVLQQLWGSGLVACEIFLGQGSNLWPCIARRTPNHWITREVSCSQYCCCLPALNILLVTPDWRPIMQNNQQLPKVNTDTLTWIFIWILQSCSFFLWPRLESKTDDQLKVGWWGRSG